MGQAAARFRDDFSTALDEPALASVGVEGIGCHMAHVTADKLDHLGDVGEAWDRPRLGARASMRSRKTGCKLRRRHDVGLASKNTGNGVLHTSIRKGRATSHSGLDYLSPIEYERNYSRDASVVSR